MPKIPTTSEVAEKKKMKTYLRQRRKRTRSKRKSNINYGCTPSTSMPKQNILVIGQNNSLNKGPICVPNHTGAVVDETPYNAMAVNQNFKYPVSQIKDQEHLQKATSSSRIITDLFPSSEATNAISETGTNETHLPKAQSLNSLHPFRITQTSQFANHSKEGWHELEYPNISSSAESTNLQPTDQKSEAQVDIANKNTQRESQQFGRNASNKLVAKYNIRRTDVQKTQSDFSHIFDSPLYTNFETTKEVADLNDAESFNKPTEDDKNPQIRLLKKNMFKKSPSFERLSQPKHAKELKTDNILPDQQKWESTESRLRTERIQDKLINKSNKELREAIYSDINTVVRANIQSKMNEEISNTPNNDQDYTPLKYSKVSNTTYSINRQAHRFILIPKEDNQTSGSPDGNNRSQDPEDALLKGPAGVPKSFLLHQNNFGAIQPQNYANSPTPSLAPRWDLNKPIYENPTAADTHIMVQTNYSNMNYPQQQQYSPTQITDMENNQVREGSESPDALDSGQKRLSAFQRLGPLSQPKKPKLTINLNLNKEQAVREVVEVQVPKDVPVQDDEEIINSKDETVVKYLPFWPWKKTVAIRKSVTVRTSRTVMMLEKEQMEEAYEKDSVFIMLSLKGYPPTWTKEDLLDLLLEHLKGKSFIPCFIEFNSNECKFFVIRCRGALLAIHWMGFCIRKDDIEIFITISHTMTNVKQLDFIPRLILRKRLAMVYDGEKKLNLSSFTLKKDLSHFLYFPLNRVSNQTELVQLQSDVVWHYLTELNLSGNKIKSLEGFTLETMTPNLNTLDLSNNYIERTTVLLEIRRLPLKKLYLEGNPLCTDFTDPARYIKVMRTMFSTLRELDGVPIVLPGDMPGFKRNYCPEDAKEITAKFLEIYFPLLDLPNEGRKCIQPMYAENAVLTITYRNKIRYEPAFKNARNLLLRSRALIERDFDLVVGAANITKLIKKWPNMEHDPSTFAVDVIYHSESSTIITINGILKLTAESLAEDETLLAFTRIVNLCTKHGYDYEIHNEMLYWDEPTEESSKRAFQLLSVPRKTNLSLKFDSVPDEEIKEKLIKIFMKLTDLNKTQSERCLEEKNWHIKDALEYFMKLFKCDNVQSLM